MFTSSAFSDDSEIVTEVLPADSASSVNVVSVTEAETTFVSVTATVKA